jgi:DNA-binding transcriptional ArsR family regulator
MIRPDSRRFRRAHRDLERALADPRRTPAASSCRAAFVLARKQGRVTCLRRETTNRGKSRLDPAPAPVWMPPTDRSLAVVLEVLIHGPLSRTEIARRLDLSQPSLTRLSAPLLDAGLLVEAGERSDGRAGRPSRPLDVIAGSRHFVGLKLTAKVSRRRHRPAGQRCGVGAAGLGEPRAR